MRNGLLLLMCLLLLAVGCRSSETKEEVVSNATRIGPDKFLVVRSSWIGGTTGCGTLKARA